MEENMSFYDYKNENGVVSAKGTYQQDGEKEIEINVVLESNGTYQVQSEHPFSEEEKKWIFRAFKITLEPSEV